MVAHDNKKVDLLGWADFNMGQLRHHQLFGAVVTQLVNRPATRTSADAHGRATRAGPRQQDIGMGLDRACVVARNRTRRRVVGCGGFPAGPVSLTF